MDEQVSVHFYKMYYDNKWSGNKVANESGLDDKQYFVSSESPVITQYTIRPELSSFMDCVRYVLNPPCLDDTGIENIGCDLYENIFRKSSTQYVPALPNFAGISSDFCSWRWNRTEELFHLSINNSYGPKHDVYYKYNAKMALTCKLSPNHRNTGKAEPNSRFLIFVTPFIHTFENKNFKSVWRKTQNMSSNMTSRHTSSSSELYPMSSIIICFSIIVIVALALILLYRYKAKHKR